MGHPVVCLNMALIERAFTFLNKRKVDEELQAGREGQTWYSDLSVHSNPDSNSCVNFLTYIL